MSHKKLMVYPYDIETCPIVRHSKLLKGYNIVKLVSPEGWGMTEKDASYADLGDKIGINVSSNFQESMIQCDAVYFAESLVKLDFNKLIMPRIMEVADAGKEIICSTNISEVEIKQIKDYCNRKNVSVRFFNNLANKSKELKIKNERIYTINVPVIFVMGVSERTHKFEIQLALREKLINMGYKVSQIGSRSYCEFLGFHSFPSFMFSEYPEHEKVIFFNRFVKSIEVMEHPDIIIIGIPGAIIPYNHILTNKFGILAYEISLAVTPDFTILSLLYNDYKPEYFEILKNELEPRFSMKLDCYNIANVSLLVQESKYNNTTIVNAIDSSFLDKKIEVLKNINIPIYNILNKNSADKLANDIVNKLSSYAELGSV